MIGKRSALRTIALQLPLALLCASRANAAAIEPAVVPGSANPNLAGRESGYSCCSGDTTPAQAPVLIAGLHGCDQLSFSVTGRVSYLPGSPTGSNPDGDDAYSMINYGDGISAPANVRVNALVGVFLDENSPTGKATPASLDFNLEAGIAFPFLAPELRQIFFIGDGQTTNSAIDPLPESGFARGSGANTQVFRVPPGGERLYLGTVDGEGWFNNSGSFQLEATIYRYNLPSECGDAIDPPGVFASDALATLRAAVGTGSCSECYCDVNHSGSIVSNDALAVLRHAVGQDVDLECPCCEFN